MKSESDPLSNLRVAYAAADTVRKAHAVGLVRERPDFAALTFPAVKAIIARIRKAGVAERAARDFEGAAPDDVDALVHDLHEIGALIEESPFPATEWRRLLEILGRDLVARLAGVSASSVVRYAGGDRRTPDDVAARVHFLALLIGDLEGAYNEIGIRRWFDRKRTALDGHTPSALFARAWQPDDPGPARVRDLARALIEGPGA